MSQASEERVKQIIEHSILYGEKSALEMFGINAESLARYKRLYPNTRLSALSKINERCNDEELNAIADSEIGLKQHSKITNFEGEIYRFAAGGDLHIGHNCYDGGWWRSAIEECKKHGIKTFYLTGDITEGMSKRDGHIYELTHLGYKKMKEYAISELSLFDGEIYMIDGNHDRWFQKSNGALIVEDICEANPNWHFLGQDEGKHIVNGVDIRLWHGEDSSSYAVSYRIQKICESFTGGEKPNLLLLGHVHKMAYFIERNIHCISTGTFEHQTKWMRGKRIAAHCGWWIVELAIKDSEIKSCDARFYPFYQ